MHFYAFFKRRFDSKDQNQNERKIRQIEHCECCCIARWIHVEVETRLSSPLLNRCQSSPLCAVALAAVPPKAHCHLCLSHAQSIQRKLLQRRAKFPSAQLHIGQRSCCRDTVGNGDRSQANSVDLIKIELDQYYVCSCTYSIVAMHNG